MTQRRPRSPSTIPSPAQGVWYLGPFPVRAYAMCILAGIVVAVWIDAAAPRRPAAARRGIVLDIAAWAVPFGIVGGRLYHVITTPQPYFGAGRRPVERVHDLGGRPRHLGRGRARRARGLDRLPARAACRSCASPTRRPGHRAGPGASAASATGSTTSCTARRPTCPGACRSTSGTRRAGRAVGDADGQPVVLGTFHPTFLYESIWCLVRRRGARLGRAPVPARPRAGLRALRDALHRSGGVVIEMLRTDTANHILGPAAQRLDVGPRVPAGALCGVLPQDRGAGTVSRPDDRAGAESTGRRPAAATPAVLQSNVDAAGRPGPDASTGPAVADAGDRLL